MMMFYYLQSTLVEATGVLEQSKAMSAIGFRCCLVIVLAFGLVETNGRLRIYSKTLVVIRMLDQTEV